MLQQKAKSMFGLLEEFRFSKAKLVAYGKFALDENPVHQTGVIYGVQLIAKIEEILCRKYRLKKTRIIDYRFLDKVRVEENIQLFSSPDLHFEVWCAQKKVGEGKIVNV